MVRFFADHRLGVDNPLDGLNRPLVVGGLLLGDFGALCGVARYVVFKTGIGEDGQHRCGDREGQE